MSAVKRQAWWRASFLLAGFAAALVTLAWPLPARAESALEVLEVGWDGTAVPGTWSPVRVRVRGGSGDARARVEVILLAKRQYGPQSPPIEFPVGAYGQEVALPAGVAKELTLWVPADGNMAGAIRLVAGGETLVEQRVEFRGARTPFWPLVGVLAESPAVARTIAQVELPFQGLPIPLTAARLAPANLPPSAERLAALSALVVQGNVAATLTGAQREAVHEWVRTGGHLVLAGGPEAGRAAAVLPVGTLPVSFSGAETSTDLSAFAEWAEAPQPPPAPGPVAHFQASAGSLLAGPRDRPLAWRLSLGQGTVTLLAADPSLQPLAAWAGTPALLQKALEPALPAGPENEKMRYLRMEAHNGAMRLQGTVEALPPEAFPGWQFVALVLGAFALLVGPLAYLVLWRADRRGLVWLVVPAAAVLVSGLLYYVGIGRDGRDVLGNVVSHVRLDPESGQARQALAAGFYAPTHPDLALTVPGEGPVRVFTRLDGDLPYGATGHGVSQPISVEPPFHVLVGRDTRVEFASGQWGMRTVALERSLDEPLGRIVASVGLEDGLLKGTLRNDTSYLLEDATVVVGQGLAKIGSLAPGQSASLVLDPGPPANPFRGGPSLSYRLFGRTPEELAAAAQSSSGLLATPTPAPAVPAPGMPERLELPRDPEVLRRARLLDSVMNGPKFGPGGQMMPLTFLGFTRAPLGQDLPSAGDHPVYHLSLLEQPLRLDLPPGPFSMPAGLIPAEVLEQASRGMGGGGNGTLFWNELHGGGITYGFRPPLPPRAHVDALVLRTQQVGQAVSMAQGKGLPPPGPSFTPGPAEAGVFGVYNWQTASWEPLPGGQEQVRLEPATPYVSPDGLVKVRVDAGEDRLLRFISPELVVEGQVVQ